ncbi:DUF3927 family protein [Aeromonas sp.]|uniref:DUF3927 family protein n=1 Tax=Aeromonas sp. TaxID=647 RepID=UPI00338DA5DF
MGKSSRKSKRSSTRWPQLWACAWRTMSSLRWPLAGAFLLLSVGVDFSSRLLSMASDALLVGVAFAILWPLMRPKKP